MGGRPHYPQPPGGRRKPLTYALHGSLFRLYFSLPPPFCLYLSASFFYRNEQFDPRVIDKLVSSSYVVINHSFLFFSNNFRLLFSKNNHICIYICRSIDRLIKIPKLLINSDIDLSLTNCEIMFEL